MGMTKLMGTIDKLKDYPSNVICEADGCNSGSVQNSGSGIF